MGKATKKTYAEELRDDWLTAGQALEKGKAARGDHAQQIIIDRLIGNKLKAYCLSWSSQKFGHSAIETSDVPDAIPADFWNYVEDHLFWTTDTVRFFKPSRNAIDPSVTIRCFDVRFDPKDIEKLFPAPKPRPASSPPLTSAKPAVGETNKPDLAPSALSHWYEAYKVAYGPHERNLDHAWEHAKAAFPEKGIARKRIRDLMPGGKRGPRAKG